MMSLYCTHTGSRSKPPLLLLHGFMGSHEDWGEIVSILAHDFFCITPDLPGHGRSRIHSHTLTFQDCLRSIESCLAQLGIPQCPCAGYSMGGRLALGLALRKKSIITKLFLESVCPGLQSSDELQARRALEEQWIDTLKNIPFRAFLQSWYTSPIFHSIAQDPKRFSSLMEQRLTNDPEELVKAIRGFGLAAQPSFWDMLSNITAQPHLCVGELDQKFCSIAKRMQEMNPHWNITKVQNVGHNIHFANPRVFAEILKDFLEKESDV